MAAGSDADNVTSLLTADHTALSLDANDYELVLFIIGNCTLSTVLELQRSWSPLFL